MDRRERLNDPEEALRAALDGWQVGVWTAFPGIIDEVNLQNMTVSVTPAIKEYDTDEDGNTKQVTITQLVNVPITYQSAGGYSMTFPIAKGDECLVIIANRCIDGWWQSGGIQGQIEFRMHDLSDGFAIVGPRSQARLIPNISTTDVQLRNDAGTTFIGINPAGDIRMKSPTQITLDAPLTTITGAIAAGDGVGGPYNAIFAGSITATGNVTGNSISLDSHTHTGVQPGSGNTGGPT